MTTHRWRWGVVSVFLAMTTLAACGGGDSSDQPTDEKGDRQQTQDDDDESDELTGRQLRSAMLNLDDIPSGFGTNFERYPDVDQTDETDVTEGPAECSEYLSGEYGADELARFREEFRDDDVPASIYTSVRSYDSGGAEEDLEAVRDLLGACGSFQVGAGEPTQVTVEVTDFDDLDGYEDLADDGVQIVFTMTNSTRTRLQFFNFLQVDDLLTTAGGQVAPEADRDLWLELAETADEKLQDLVSEIED